MSWASDLSNLVSGPRSKIITTSGLVRLFCSIYIISFQYVLSFLYYMILHVIIFGYKLHIIIIKCHTSYVGKMGVASERM